MNDSRYENLSDALISHFSYCRFIETYGEEKIDFQNINFDLLQTITSGCLLTLLIDDYFKKENSKTTSILMPEMTKYLTKIVAESNGKGYTLGDLMYHDECTVLEKIRNKLAHGDFIVKDGQIIFEENKVQGRVDAEKLLKLVSNLESYAHKYTLYLPTKKVFNKIVNKFNITTITNEKEFDEVCDNLYRVEISDAPVILKKRDNNYIYIRSKFYEELETIIGKISVSKLEEFLEEEKDLLLKYGIKIIYSIKNIKEQDYYYGMKEKYMSMIDFYKDLSFETQINIINNSSYILGFGKLQNKNIKKGLELNAWLMQKVKENPNYSLIDIIENDKKMHDLIMYHHKDIIIVSYLLSFCAFYQYGLENGLTKIGSYDLMSILEGKLLDFSKLKIDELEDPNMKIEHEFSKFLTNIEEYEKRELKFKDDLIEKIQSKISQYVDNCKNPEECKIKKINDELEEANQLKLELENKIKKLKELEKDFDLDKYTRNFNIITHIRNAIAHGNVLIDSHYTDIMEADIEFNDLYDGKSTYYKKIKVKDFLNLFRNSNVLNIHNCLTNNIIDEIFVDENSYEDKKQSCITKRKNFKN